VEALGASAEGGHHNDLVAPGTAVDNRCDVTGCDAYELR